MKKTRSHAYASGHQQAESAGWTLIELICVLAISSILLLLPLNSGWRHIREQQVFNVYVQALLADLQSARLLASNTATSISLQAIDSNWRLGWLIVGGATAYSSPFQVNFNTSWKSGFTSSAGPTFLAGGARVTSPGSFYISDPGNGRKAQIIIAKSGRARLVSK